VAGLCVAVFIRSQLRPVFKMRMKEEEKKGRRGNKNKKKRKKKMMTAMSVMIITHWFKW
jgi:hypothetical protein